MTRFKDAVGVRCSVRRVWWPFGTIAFDPGDSGVFFWIGLMFTLPALIIWPFWLAARFFGAPWTIVVRRKGDDPREEKVRGWAASRARIAEIVAELQRPLEEPETRATIV